jgi:ribA/ribD-fused uncharacterized protein
MSIGRPIRPFDRGWALTDRILFYRTGEAFGKLSNFAAFPIRVDGAVWPASEHFFQAQKFLSPVDREAIRAEPSPMKAAKMGRDRTRPLRADWEAVKVSVMAQALRAKFTQHQRLATMLADTGDAELIEHTANDRYWADGGDGTGQNMLGKLLMRVRAELREPRPLEVDPPCDHLRPLESALIAAGIRETARGQTWSKNCRLWVYFDCRLDLPSLRGRFGLAPCVVDHQLEDSHLGEELGFVCNEHLDGVMGTIAGRIFR